MLVSSLLILLIAAGGFALTYLIEEDGPFLWRSAAGAVIGSSIYGTLVFVIGCAAGLTIASPVALALTLLPLLLFRDGERLRRFRIDWQRAMNKMQGGSWAKFLRFAFYAFFFLLFCFFFSQAMYQTPAGIFTGGSNNLGDLPFHLGAIFGFTDGNNLPPQNPSFAGAKFSYPFVADIVTAGFMKLGADVRSAMIVQDIVWAFSLLVVLERFVFRLTRDRLAGKIAPWLLFFSGGLGFLWFFQDYWAQGKGFFEFLNNLPKDYTIGDDFRWGNSMITLFLTQRSFLLGMPLTILVLAKLWNWFAIENEEKGKSESDAVTPQNFFTLSHFHIFTLPFLVGLLAGLLPLIHLHSLVVLFVVTIFMIGLNPENWRTWFAFGLGVALIAIPELIWSITGSATRTSEFIGWNFGWDKGDANILWFWFFNTGLVIPFVGLGIYLYLSKRRRDESESEPMKLWLFYTPFLFLFIVSNAAKLAPWQWDNIKVLIYWFVGSLPFIAFTLSWLWRQKSYLAVVAALGFLSLVLSGALDVYRTASGQVKTRVFDPDAIRIAEQIKAKTAPNALFLNAATYNTAIVLTGRESLMRYPGHLSSHGIDFAGREADVKQIYQGAPAADQLLAKYGIDYVLVSQEETSSMSVNQDYFKKFPVAATAGSATVYKVR
jgi:hypothetical protein